MNRVCQIICYVVSLIGVVFTGGIFNVVFWQVSIHARLTLGDKPLPHLTQFFIEHRNLPFYLVVIPWLFLVGAPLVSREGALKYWDATSFLLRYAAFITVEAFLFGVLYLWSVAPFLEIYKSADVRGYNGLDLIFGVVFWSLAALVVSGTVYRARRRKFTS